MLKEFLIPFTGLKDGKHTFSAKVEQAFFDCFENEDLTSGDVEVDFLLNKHSSFLELNISAKGSVNSICDRCGDTLSINITSERDVVIKFGENFNYEGDDIMVLPSSSSDIDTKQLVYESISLALPLRKVHKKSDCNPKAIEALKKIQIKESVNEQTDPRWDALKQFKQN